MKRTGKVSNSGQIRKNKFQSETLTNGTTHGVGLNTNGKESTRYVRYFLQPSMAPRRLSDFTLLAEHDILGEKNTSVSRVMISADMDETHASNSGKNGATSKHVREDRFRAIVESVDSERQKNYWVKHRVRMSANARGERGTMARTTNEDLIDNE